MTQLENPGGVRTGPTTARVPYLAGDLLAVPEAVTVLRRVVMAFAAAHGVDETMWGPIGLAVTEGVGNVVMHAYDPGNPGYVHLAVDVEEDELQIVIADDGRGIRAGASDGQGLGLGLIASVSSDFAIRERRPRGTEIWVRFLL
jgi:anti-sigma regulatory factor (Ser/Thr protein kinase)